MKTILVIAALNGFLIAFMITQFSNPNFTKGLNEWAEFTVNNTKR